MAVMKRVGRTPDDFSYSSLGLPNFHETSVTWDGDTLSYRSTGEPDREFDPAAEDWETVWDVLDALRAWDWEPSYADHGILDGMHWTFSVSRGGRAIHCHGANAFPPGFRTLVGAINLLVGGALSEYGHVASARSLVAAARTAGKVHDGPAAAVPALAEALRRSAWDESGLKAAAEGLGTLGRHAVPAVPVLLESLGSDCGVFLTYAGRDALQAIAGDFDRADPEERRRLAEPALGAVVAALAGGKLNADLRRPLVSILRSVGFDHPGATDAVVATLRDPDRWLFQSAAYALEAMKPPPPGAVAVLLDTLRDKLTHRYGFTSEVIRALKLYGDAEAERALPVLLPALDHPDAETRARAVEGLSELGAAARAAIPRLIAGLSAPDDTMQWRAAEALGNIGPEAADAVPALIHQLRTAAGFVRWRSAAALGKIGRPEAIPALVEALSSDSHDVPKTAAYALKAFGPAAAGAVGDLAHVLRPGNPAGHWGAAFVLGHLGESAAPAVPALAAALAGDSSEWDRLECATALGRIGPPAHGAGPALTKALDDPSVHVRIGAANALRLVGYEPAAAVPVLAAVATKRQAKSWERERAVEVLAEFGPDAVAVVPALEVARTDPEERVRTAAEKALRAIRGSA